MKLLVNLDDFSVHVATDAELSAVTSNGQHDQLSGFVIADINLSDGILGINLFHPNTQPSSGHVDVVVYYNNGKVFFHGHDRVSLVLEEGLPILETVFPTGAWSLVQVSLAVERYMYDQFRYPCLLKKLLLSGLK